MDEKTAKTLTKALEENTKELKEQNRLTRLLAGKTGQNVQGHQTQRGVDPLTAHLRGMGLE